MNVLRYTAFSADPAGGNPAGVVLDASGATDAQMLAVAAEVGYSETAFVVGGDSGRFDIRYFSPLMEVAFCGHATIATAVAYAQRHGTGSLVVNTKAGRVDVSTESDADGAITATLVSIPPKTDAIAEADLTALLAALNWTRADLDPALPVRAGFAGM